MTSFKLDERPFQILKRKTKSLYIFAFDLVEHIYNDIKNMDREVCLPQCVSPHDR